jgi:hypothetical protein
LARKTKTKKQLYEKIKFKKLLSVFKTDKIANLHGHEVLRTPVRHCELNPIELIWAQVKGYIQSVIYNWCTLQSVIMLDWIQLSSSLDSSSSKSIIIGGISLLSMQFSFLVLDNARYHNIKTEETVVPNFNQRKAVLQGYLSKNDNTWAF